MSKAFIRRLFLDNCSQLTSLDRKMLLINHELSQGRKRLEQLSILHKADLVDDPVAVLLAEAQSLKGVVLLP